MHVWTFQENNTKREGEFRKPNEDALGRANEDRVIVVADGIGLPVPLSEYPSPSPSALAAQACVQVLSNELFSAGTDVKKITHGFRMANEAVGKVNGSFDLKPDKGFGLAGAVAAVLSIVPGEGFAYGVLGDCGVGLMDRNGFLVQSPDYVARSYPNRAYEPEWSKLERWSYVAQHHRNQLDKDLDKTFGVLTGEAAALRYLVLSVVPLRSDDFCLLVYSDGALPYLKDRAFLQMIRAEEFLELTHMIQRGLRSGNPEYADDCTLAIVYL